MRQAKILYKNMDTGILIQHDDGSFTFRYNDSWMKDVSMPAISLTLSKQKQEYHSKSIFPFFYNMLPEGSNRQIVSRLNRIELNDYFGLLVATAKSDSIGAVRVVKFEYDGIE